MNYILILIEQCDGSKPTCIRCAKGSRNCQFPTDRAVSQQSPDIEFHPGSGDDFQNSKFEYHETIRASVFDPSNSFHTWKLEQSSPIDSNMTPGNASVNEYNHALQTPKQSPGPESSTETL